MDRVQELVQKLERQGCPSCGAKIKWIDGSLLGARPSAEEDRFDGPALIVCLACGNGVRVVGPSRLPREARRIT